MLLFMVGVLLAVKKDSQGDYNGISYIKTPTFFHKYLETPINALTAYLDTFKRKFDLILICNAANSPFAWILKFGKAPFLINVDGIERRRSKWNALGKVWYFLGEKASVCFANKIVADADVIADYYRENYQIEPAIIRYGARVNAVPAGEVLKEFNLQANSYILYVSRLEPENNALGVIQAYNQLDADLPLVIVGDAPYAKEYIEQVKFEAQGKSVIFTGYQFGEAYQELRSNCLFYIQATEVGGTHPALVEAIAYGNCVIANDVPEHREVLREAGIYYNFNDFNDLSKKMGVLLKDHAKIALLREEAKKLATQNYQWSQIAGQYQELFYSMLA